MNQGVKHARKAEKQLKKCSRNLGRAKTLGFFDALGGKVPVDFAKNFFFSRAKKNYQKSQGELQKIRAELHHINLEETPLKISFFLSFLDLFSQDPLSDWMVLSQIAKAKKAVKERRKEVKALREQLEQMQIKPMNRSNR